MSTMQSEFAHDETDEAIPFPELDGDGFDEAEMRTVHTDMTGNAPETFSPNDVPGVRRPPPQPIAGQPAAPARPQSQRRVSTPNRPVPKVPVTKTPFDAAMEAVGPERQQQLLALKERFKETRDSVVWEIVEALAFSESFYNEIPQKLLTVAEYIQNSTEEVQKKAVDELGTAIGALNHDRISTGIANAVTKKVGKGFHLRLRMYYALSGAALVLTAALIGFFVGHTLDVGHYREAYTVKMAGVPHIHKVLLSADGQALLEMVEHNDPATLKAIADCSASLGLRLQKSGNGGRVCGGAGATEGWWPR